MTKTYNSLLYKDFTHYAKFGIEPALYLGATTKPWRAGTPGRAPRYRRAVVDYRRPLCLFMHIKFVLVAVFAALTASALPASAQSFHFRVGAMVFTPLVEQNVREVRDSALGAIHPITVKQQPAPVISAGVSYPLRAQLMAELSGSYAWSALRGEDDLGEWDAADLSLINVIMGVRYRRWPTFSIDGGVGFTKLMGSSTGMFSKGNGLRPVFEAGITADMPGRIPMQIIARAQTHMFTTGTLHDESADQGQVWRGLVQLGTTFGRKR